MASAPGKMSSGAVDAQGKGGIRLSMRTYSEYKHSGIDWLGTFPAHWSKLAIKHLATEKGTLFIDGDWIESSDLAEEGIRYITTGNVGQGFYKEQGSGFISEETFERIRCTEVFPGDLIISRLNSPIGRACIVPDLHNRIVTSVDNVIVRSDSRYSKKYLMYLFSSYEYLNNTENLARGATMQRISRGILGNIRIPIPSSFVEQESIASFLDREIARIYNLIAEKQNFINLLKEKRQALISHVVTKGLDPKVKMKESGIEWIGEVPEHWALCKLSFRYEVQLGKMLDDKKITGEHLGRYLRNSDVQWDQINDDDLPQMDFRPDEVGRYSVQKGDLLVCEGGEIGRCAIWEKDEPCFYQKALHRVRPHSRDRDVTRFLFYALSDAVSQERFISEANKATIAHLPAEAFRQYKFAFPPFKEQEQIAAYLDGEKRKYDALIAEVNASIELLKEHRTALISAAVTGKIDVRNH